MLSGGTDVLHKDKYTVTEAFVEQKPQNISSVFYTRFLIYLHIHCHVKLTGCINWQCSIINYYTWQLILLEVYIYPSPSTNFGILYVKEGIAMMTDILKQKHDIVYRMQQIIRLMEETVYCV
jgi:hypothetical protein